MQLDNKKSFLKMYAKLNDKDKNNVDNALIIFSENPMNEKLKNHSVSPTFPGCRSINA